MLCCGIAPVVGVPLCAASAVQSLLNGSVLVVLCIVDGVIFPSPCHDKVVSNVIAPKPRSVFAPHPNQMMSFNFSIMNFPSNGSRWWVLHRRWKILHRLAIDGKCSSATMEISRWWFFPQLENSTSTRRSLKQKKTSAILSPKSVLLASWNGWRTLHLIPVNGDIIYSIHELCVVQTDHGCVLCGSLAIHDMHLIANKPFEQNCCWSFASKVSWTSGNIGSPKIIDLFAEKIVGVQHANLHHAHSTITLISLSEILVGMYWLVSTPWSADSLVLHSIIFQGLLALWASRKRQHDG